MVMLENGPFLTPSLTLRLVRNNSSKRCILARMSTSLSRNRTKNAIFYFASNTRACGKIKLFKLLYLLDFEHFRQTGRSVTGYEYEAWKFGPVPASLMEEWEALDDDLSQYVTIIPEQVIKFFRETVVPVPGAEFDDSDFTPRQMKIMSDLATEHRDTLSGRMIDVTHAQNGAWDRVWSGGEGRQEPIPYALALPENSPHRAAILESAAEHKAFERAHG
jgi:uncharacterized phage-associated protein